MARGVSGLRPAAALLGVGSELPKYPTMLALRNRWATPATSADQGVNNAPGTRLECRHPEQVKEADTPEPKWYGGGPGGCSIHQGLLPCPPGIEQAATGRFHFFVWNWGTPTPPCPVRGSEHASSREGGRRQRSSLTPGCNDQDMVKV